MKIALISDVHGNLEALSAVWTDLTACGAAEVFCLGDSVGYGPDPEAVVFFLRDQGVESVMGNHEMGLAEPSYLKWFNPMARMSLLRSKELLSSESLDYLKQLPHMLITHGCRLVHGLPPESVGTYLNEVTDWRLASEMAAVAEDLCFVGHTHHLNLVRITDGSVKHIGLKQETRLLEPEAGWIANIGSVGMPQDGDFSAKYALYDLEARELEIRFVAYDPTETKRKIRERGLGDIYALRLG